MPPPARPTDRGLLLAPTLGLGLVLVVVLAAASIRLGWSLGWIRGIHRVAASLEVLVALWLGWMAWRARASRPAVFRAALLALLLTALLSAVGIASGQNPPPAAAAANLLGGLALVAVFAWLIGALQEKRAGLVLPFYSLAVGLLLALQLALGARLAIVERFAPALPVHALVAIPLGALLGWLALARMKGRAGALLFGLALAAPLAGFTSLHYEHSALAALAHAAAAALLLASSAYALGRAT